MIRLSEATQAGDVADVTEEFSMNATAQARTDFAETKEMPLTNTIERQYRVRVLAADVKGNPTAQQFVVTREREAAQIPGRKKVSRVSSTEGKTVTVKRAGRKTVVTVDHGSLSAKDKADFAETVAVTGDAPFPDYALGIGEEWSMETRRFVREFGGDSASTLTGKIVDVVQKYGHPCAHAKLNMEFTGHRKQEELEISMKLSGDLYFATDLKRIVAVTLTGPVTITGEIVISGVQVALAGDGNAKLNFVTKWVRVGGRAVKG
jgi:hypothetical protein